MLMTLPLAIYYYDSMLIPLLPQNYQKLLSVLHSLYDIPVQVYHKKHLLQKATVNFGSSTTLDVVRRLEGEVFV